MAVIKMLLTNGFMPDPRVYKEALYLVNHGHEVEVLCWDRKNEFKDSPSEELDGIKITRFFPYAEYGTGLSQLKAYGRYIKECKAYLSGQEYHYLHCHDLDGSYAGVKCCSKNARLVIDLHEIYELQLANLPFKKVAIFVLRKFLHYLQRKAYKIIYLSNIQKRYIQKRYRERLVYLPNYAEKRNLQSYRYIPSEKIRIGFIGLVDARTSFDALFKAAGNDPAFEILIWGDGLRYEEVKQKAEPFENIKVFGRYRYEDTADLYGNIDLIFSAGLQESEVFRKLFGEKAQLSQNKYYEALLTGTPVITNRDNANADFVLENEIGFAVDDMDIRTIEEMLDQLKNDPALLPRLRANAEKWKDEFAWEKACKVLEDIYQNA